MKEKIKQKDKLLKEIGKERYRRWHIYLYLFYMWMFFASPTDFYQYKLYCVFCSHRDYLKTTVRYKNKWKNAKEKYKDKGRVWMAAHWLDYTLSRLLYPGLTARDYFMYEFYNYRFSKRKSYVTDGFLKKMDWHFNHEHDNSRKIMERRYLCEKDLFNSYFSEFIHRKWLVCDKTTSVDAMTNHFEGVSRLVIKPIDGVQGKSVRKIDVVGLKTYMEIHDMAKEHRVLVEENIEQCESLKKLNPSSVNTLRVYSVEYKDEIYITGASIRIGRARMVVDNFSAGGIGAGVDIATGIVYTKGRDSSGNEYLRHPDTDEVILGMEVPYWESIVNAVKKAHKMLSELRYIGWDVTVAPDGKVSFVEANIGAGVDILQTVTKSGVKPVYMKLW